MPTLTIEVELPEAEYRFASALPADRLRHLASIGAGAAFATARDAETGAADGGGGAGWHDPTPFTRDEIAGLAEAVAAQDAGLTVDGDEFFERLYREKGWTLKP